jgi:hypothetical protein
MVPSQWNKVHRMNRNLPAAATLQLLLGVFFDEANWYFGTIDKVYFRQAFTTWQRTWDTNSVVEQRVSADTLSFPALLFQLLALAVQFLPPNSAAEKAALQEPAPSLSALSKHYSESGERLLNTIGRHIGSIVAAQADLMRCAWLKNDGRGAEAWYSLGNAVR